MSRICFGWVSGGYISESKCYDGVVFSSDVVNRKMETDIDNCPLIVIQMPLTFDKYNVRTDLDNLRDQEQIYLDLKVEKISKDVMPESPKLFICQGVVSQLALERILKKGGLSVIIGVPEHILRAISRCTGSRVTPAVDSIVRKTLTPSKDNHVGGKAQRFYVSRVGYVGEEGYKALTVIEAAAGHKGKFSTVCLRGPTAKLAKPVLRWAIRLARHLQLESELLFELWCQPWQRELEKHGEEGDDLESCSANIGNIVEICQNGKKLLSIVCCHISTILGYIPVFSHVQTIIPICICTFGKCMDNLRCLAVSIPKG